MAVKDPVKNQEYVAKHRKNVREQMGEEAYKKREAEARRLRRQKQVVQISILCQYLV